MTYKKPQALTPTEEYLLIEKTKKDLWNGIDFSKTKFVIYNNKVEEAYIQKSLQACTLICFINEGEFRRSYSRNIFDTKEEAVFELNWRNSVPKPMVSKKIINWRGEYKIVDDIQEVNT